MDLRYLEFLLSSCSWITVVFSVVMLLWLILNNVSEIGIGIVKVKPTIALRSLGSLLLLMFSYWFYVADVIERVNVEINLQSEFQNTEPDSSKQQKEKWKGFFEDITHSSNTMAFAFVKPIVTNNQYEPASVKLEESSVQFFVVRVLYILPLIFLGFELAILDFLLPLSEFSIMGFLILGVVSLYWIIGVSYGLGEIRAIVLELARLATVA